ncbi:MAG: hypothetical protein GY754_01700 [bacterium]|nr:hypothetical protein [bacterium]
MSEYGISMKINTTIVFSLFLILLVPVLPVYSQAPEEAKPEITENKKAESGQNDPIVTPTGLYLRAIVPGWGQFYTEYSFRGWVFSGSFALSGGFLAWAIINQRSTANEYSSLPLYTSQAVFNEKWENHKAASRILLGAAILTAAVYIANWVDILFFNKYSVYCNQEPSIARKGQQDRTYVHFDIWENSSNSFERGISLCLGKKF